ncbi:MAG TPA: SRPBCC family protein [Puia sp.]|nr:SRPBCC family protein [Puia sp.]
MAKESISLKDPRVNTNKTERALSAIAGSLILYKITQKHKADSLLLLAGGYLLYRGISGHCPIHSLFSGRKRADHARNVNVRASVVVNRPREEVYAFWRRLENLPLFMRHLESVDEIDNTTSAWKVRLPGGLGFVRWEAEIVKEEEGTMLSWQSVPGASIQNAGKINFSDTPGRGTRIDALISYHAPMGTFGEEVSHLLTPVFSEMVKNDILGFKHFMEDTYSV